MPISIVSYSENFCTRRQCPEEDPNPGKTKGRGGQDLLPCQDLLLANIQEARLVHLEGTPKTRTMQGRSLPIVDPIDDTVRLTVIYKVRGSKLVVPYSNECREP
jgi:hypothetical protein